jgi:hypothetical protein
MSRSRRCCGLTWGAVAGTTAGELLQRRVHDQPHPELVSAEPRPRRRPPSSTMIVSADHLEVLLPYGHARRAGDGYRAARRRRRARLPRSSSIFLTGVPLVPLPSACRRTRLPLRRSAHRLDPRRPASASASLAGPGPARAARDRPTTVRVLGRARACSVTLRSCACWLAARGRAADQLHDRGPRGSCAPAGATAALRRRRDGRVRTVTGRCSRGSATARPAVTVGPLVD